MHGAIALLDPALKWCVRGLKIVETEQPIGVFDVVAVDLTSAWGWDCFWYPTVKPKAGQSKTDAMRSAAPVSGAPLDGGHADRPIGGDQCRVEVACGKNVEDEEKCAIDAAHEEVMEGDCGRRAGAERCRGVAGRALQTG